MLSVLKTIVMRCFVFLETGLTHEVTGDRGRWSVCSLLSLSCNLLNMKTYAVGSV